MDLNAAVLHYYYSYSCSWNNPVLAFYQNSGSTTECSLFAVMKTSVIVSVRCLNAASLSDRPPSLISVTDAGVRCWDVHCAWQGFKMTRAAVLHCKGNICHLLNTVGLLRGVGTVTQSVLNLPVKNRTFQRDAEESTFMSLSLLCDWSKWVFSLFHCHPRRPYGNAIHTFFPADLLGRFKAPHLSVWEHPWDLARSLIGVLARARTSRLPGMDRWPPLACCDLHWHCCLF